MKNILFLLSIVACLFFVSDANAQYNYPHQHNGVWHTHPHSAPHYHDYWGGATIYPSYSYYNGRGVWTYIPGAYVAPRRRVIIGVNAGWYTQPCQPYNYYYYWRK